MHDSDSKQGRSLAEERFHSWLAEREEGNSSGLEELCSAHPENSSVFKELYQKWEGARRLLDLGVGAPETLSIDLGKLVDEVVESCRRNLVVWETYFNGICHSGDALDS